MSKRIDLTGRRFGRLVVIRWANDLYCRWVCICDCGNSSSVVGSKLRTGHTRSCGCLEKELTAARFRLKLKGQKFGYWKVLRFAGIENGETCWHCMCVCGEKRKVYASNLRLGKSRSCGCYRAISNIESRTTHGMTKSRIYGIWSGIIQRCTNQKTTRWMNYGGRGIDVCTRWKNFVNFYEDMGSSYISHALQFGERNTTIERIDNDGMYSPENCRWAGYKEQARNRRREIRTFSFNYKLTFKPM